MHLSILNFKIYWFHNIKIFYSNSILYSENVNIKIFPKIDYALVACVKGNYCLFFPPNKLIFRTKTKLTCMATGKSFCASGGKKTSTAFLVKGVLP